MAAAAGGLGALWRGGAGGERGAALARGLAQALGAPLAVLQPGSVDLRSALPRLRALRVRVAVCDRAALGAEPRRALHDAGDDRVAVLIAPAVDAA